MEVMNYQSSATSYRGFTLIESLVFLFLFALISVVFFQMYATGTRLIIESKNRLGATALANQKMEIIRSINYDAIGTTTGIPAGDLLENETISVNTAKYQVHTFVQYVDDPFDRLVSSTPPDTIPTDYKRVRLTISWGNLGTDQTVIIFGNFSPKGVETASSGGVLSINVLNGSGAGVSGVSVHIVNASSGVNVTASTDATGNLMLPGAPAGSQNYTLTVSKNAYYGATTRPPYPTSAYNPVDVHASVVAGVLNQKTIVMDQSSDITLSTKDSFGTTLPNVAYTLAGGRILGTDSGTGAPVYEFSATGTTNASGVVSHANQSYGQYTTTITSAGYEFYSLLPEGAVVNVFTASAGAPADVTAVLLDKNIGSIKIKVLNQVDGSVLSGASVHVSNSSLPYDVTVTTNQYGYAYLPTVLLALVPATYDIEVSLSGFNNQSDSVSVNGALASVTIQLSP